MAHADFSKAFLQIMSTYKPLQTNWQDSSAHLRLMLKTGPLSIFDLSNNPELFFLAHRLLADSLCAGFGIRYTVMFNLFAGSVIGLGTDQQAQFLKKVQEKGELGCFALTEKSAGVLSGLIVNTTATYDKGKKKFILNTPDPGSAKYWISQGLAAEWCVVVAALVTNDPKDASKMKKYGPHAFVIRIRDSESGKLIPGVTATDMGQKTVANDLDNASLTFENVEMAPEALLQRYSTLDWATGLYKQVGKERMRIEVIGQRLLTGRLAIAEMAVEGVKKIFDSVEKYAAKKMIHPGPGVSYPLLEVPQLKAVFTQNLAALKHIQKYSLSVEKTLCECLRKNIVPPRRLVEEIAVAKIKALEISVEAGHRLEQEVGSFVLMEGSGFEHKDILLCCKFAEGDSRILQQKLVRDCLKWVSELGWGARINHLICGGEWSRGRMTSAMKLAKQLANDAKNLGPIKAWNQAYKEVYNYSDFLCDKYITARIGSGVSKL